MNAGELSQIVTNLAVNADHAMKGQGALAITLSRVELSPDAAAALHVAPGAFFVLRVSDNGTGMDRETQARIFDPFFTTKPVGQGTGLGLSMVHGILKTWNGAIEVDSEPCRGTAFRIYFPLAAPE